MTLNMVNLVGRAGREPDVKYFESGNVVCTLSLAVNRAKKDEPPDWFELEIWGKTAQIAADYVKKGSLIGVTGMLKFDYWNDRNSGVQRSKPLIRVNNLNLLGSKQENNNESVF